MTYIPSNDSLTIHNGFKIYSRYSTYDMYSKHSNICTKYASIASLNKQGKNDLVGITSYSPFSHSNAETIFIKGFYENISELIVCLNKFNDDISL